MRLCGFWWVAVDDMWLFLPSLALELEICAWMPICTADLAPHNPGYHDPPAEDLPHMDATCFVLYKVDVALIISN